MSGGFSLKRLMKEIFSRSRDQSDWEMARQEWGLVEIQVADEPEQCICGHYPIIEICTIENRLTRKTVDVGNVCVKRFLGIRSDLIFISIKRIEKDINKSLNAGAITHFHKRGLLSNWECQFLQDTCKKRKLSVGQSQKRQEINRKVLGAIKKKGFRGDHIGNR